MQDILVKGLYEIEGFLDTWDEEGSTDEFFYDNSKDWTKKHGLVYLAIQNIETHLNNKRKSDDKDTFYVNLLLNDLSELKLHIFEIDEEVNRRIGSYSKSPHDIQNKEVFNKLRGNLKGSINRIKKGTQVEMAIQKLKKAKRILGEADLSNNIQTIEDVIGRQGTDGRILGLAKGMDDTNYNPDELQKLLSNMAKLIKLEDLIIGEMNSAETELKECETKLSEKENQLTQIKMQINKPRRLRPIKNTIQLFSPQQKGEKLKKLKTQKQDLEREVEDLKTQKQDFEEKKIKWRTLREKCNSIGGNKGYAKIGKLVEKLQTEPELSGTNSNTDSPEQNTRTTVTHETHKTQATDVNCGDPYKQPTLLREWQINPQLAEALGVEFLKSDPI